MSIVALIRVGADVAPKTLVEKYGLPKADQLLAIDNQGNLCKKYGWKCWPEEVEVDSAGIFHKLSDDKEVSKDDIVSYPTPEQRDTFVTIDTYAHTMVNLEEFLKDYSGEVTIIKSIVTK